MHKPKILILASLSNSLLNFRGDMIQYLLVNNFEVLCAAPRFDEKTKAILENMGVTCEEFTMSNTSLNPITDIKSIFQLSRIIKKHQVDVIFPYTIKPVIYGSIAAWGKRVSVISLITGLGFTFSAASTKARILQKITSFLYRLALKNNSIVLFQNKDDLQLFRDHNIISKDKPCDVVHGSGINLTKFEFISREKFENETIKFIIVGRLIAEKGAQLFMDAAKHLKSKYPHAEFHIAGGWSKEFASSVSMDEIKRLKDENIIIYHGYQRNIVSILNQTDVFVLPSYYREGVPRSILEALSCGMPVITTYMPGCKETVIEGENGILIQPKELAPLIDAMEYFILNPNSIKIMGYKSRQLAESKFDVNIINSHILQNIRKFI